MNIKRTMCLWAVLLMIIAAVITTSVPSAVGAESENQMSLNNQRNSQSGEDNNQSAEEALLYDAGIYAKVHGVTVDEAIRRFKLQDDAGALDAELSSKESDTFAGLWLEHTPEFKILVQFTCNATEKIKPYLKENMVNTIEVRTAKTSLVDLHNTHSNVLSSFRSLGIHSDSGIDVRQNRVKFYITKQEQTKINFLLLNGQLGLPNNVDLVTVEALATPRVNIYGGLPVSNCTSGFGCKRADGTKGITTAGHCPDLQFYQGAELPYQQGQVSGYYDIQWNTAPTFTVINKIQVSSGGTTRDITATKAWADQAIGEWVSKYGNTTGYTAGYISSKTIVLDYVPYSEATFVKVIPNIYYPVICQGGDSGGPWFVSNTAYGSCCANDPDGNGYYMTINLASSGIGVTIMTTP